MICCFHVVHILYHSGYAVFMLYIYYTTVGTFTSTSSTDIFAIMLYCSQLLVTHVVNSLCNDVRQFLTIVVCFGRNKMIVHLWLLWLLGIYLHSQYISVIIIDHVFCWVEPRYPCNYCKFSSDIVMSTMARYHVLY